MKSFTAKDAEDAKEQKSLTAKGAIPHPFPFSRVEKGKLEPPLSAGERGGGEVER